jgi:hypothetical protein
MRETEIIQMLKNKKNEHFKIEIWNFTQRIINLKEKEAQILKNKK